MPCPTRLNHHADYVALASSPERSAAREHNDCAVVAVTAATGRSYNEVHAAMAAMGRKARRGTHMHITEKVLNQFGFTMVCVDRYEMIQQYPGAHGRVLRSITTHHPDRFPKVWRNGKTYLFRTTRHILCVKAGVNMDWTRGKALRCREIYEVVPTQTQELKA